MFAYIFIIVASGAFSFGFLFNKLYTEKYGNSFQNAVFFTFFTSMVSALSMFGIGRFKLEINLFSLVIATIYSINGFLVLFMGFKALKYANLSIYSMFLSVGSIIIPSTAGIVFYNENITVCKILCYFAIIIAIYLNIKKGEADRRAIKYYIAIFFGNGMSGVLSKIHQSNVKLKVPTESFILQSNIITLLICITILTGIFIKQKKNGFDFKGVRFAIGNGLFTALGNFLSLYALFFLQISVQTVISTGAILLFSTLISVISKEKLTKKNLFSLFFSILASILAVF